MSLDPREDALVATFFRPDEGASWRSRLASPKTRAKILDKLNHAVVFDDRWVTPVNSVDELEQAYSSLARSGRAYCLSDIADLDGRELATAESFEVYRREAWGTIFFDAAHLVAAYGGESFERLLLLRRSGGA